MSAKPIFCPFCGESTQGTFMVKDGAGLRVACNACQHEPDEGSESEITQTGQKDDFLREVMIYQGTANY